MYVCMVVCMCVLLKTLLNKIFINCKLERLDTCRCALLQGTLIITERAQFYDKRSGNSLRRLRHEPGTSVNDVVFPLFRAPQPLRATLRSGTI
jgi:hypothetical protein